MFCELIAEKERKRLTTDQRAIWLYIYKREVLQ